MRTHAATTTLAILSAAIMAAVTCAADPATGPGITKEIALGAEMPAFALPDVVTGKTVSSADMAGKKVKVIIIMCRHCPFVQHVLNGLVAFGNDYKDKDVAIVGISCNDIIAYKLDAPESLKEMAVEKKLPFPLLYDESQKVAQAYTALVTPEFFIFDDKGLLRYHGQFDDTRPGGAKPVTGADVRAAVDALLAGKPVPAPQKRAIGCSIKWKKDNTPAYAH